MKRIFISYKRVDKDQVFRIKDKIEAELGEKCWVDVDGIESDAQFKNVIIKAIKECEIVLFMYSKAHLKITDFENDWTVRELNFAAKKKKRIVFINLDNSPLIDTFEFDYGTKQQVDGTSDQALSRLIQDLKKWLASSKSISPEAELKRKEAEAKIAKEKAEAEQKARAQAEAELKQKETEARIAKEKAEAEQRARAQAEAELKQKETEARIAKEKVEAEQRARALAEEKLKQKEAEAKIAKEKAEAEQKARAQAEAELKQKEADYVTYPDEEDNNIVTQSTEKAKNWLWISLATIIAICAFGLYRFSTNNSPQPQNIVGERTVQTEAKPKSVEDNKVFTSVEQMPQFPGGDAGLMNFIATHLQYPPKAQERGIQGKVIVQFAVTKTGAVADVKVVQSLSPDCDAEVIRIVKMLRFTPGKRDGQPVNVWYTLPITFKLQN